MAHVGPQLAGQAGHMAEISLSKAATVAEGVSGSLGSGASSIGSRPDKFATSINSGAGIEAGKPLFTVADISTLWVIANVPEAQVGSLRVGTPAEVHAAALGAEAISGRVAYIDPVLSEDTRTARVRIEVENRQERLKVGMFVDVGFEAGARGQGKLGGNELVIPEEAVQRINERTVVFLPKEGEKGHFETRDVELGGASGGYQRVISGLKPGERIVSKGSFTLKTQLLKGEMGEHD